ncbi:MAG: tetratricopeptide (TPR) repeat protein, partial [Myxococcota bacterium]
MLSFLVVLQACSPSDPLEEIRQEQARGQLEPSIEKLRVLLAERQGDAELLYLYGQTLSLSGRAGLAEWALREAMRDPEWLVPAGMQLATDLARSRNFEMAIEIATAVLEAEPDSIDALLIRASANAHSRMFYEEALADVARVLELEPDNIDVMEPQILSLLALDRIDEVATAMDELGRKIDENDSEGGAPAWHCATTAIFADESGDLELAKTRWANCLESHPSNNEVVLKSLPFYDKLGQF